MAPICQINGQWETTRHELGTFSAKATNISLARSKYPFQRTVAPAQIELIESLRRNYAKNVPHHDPDKTIKVERYEIVQFNLNSKNPIKIPTFCAGLYTKNSGVVVDFANKQLGGGFLTYGLAQEEVMFLERLDIAFYAAMMYTKNEPFEIKDCEALSISGADKWAALEFYGRVPDDWDDRSTFLNEPEACEAIIAIDCLQPEFKKYEKGDLQWVLKKAYVGFQSVPNDTISTGNWGCGVFQNNKSAMLCIQALAAALAGKTLKYHARQGDCADGLALITKWVNNNTSIKNAFNELIEECATNAAYQTTWDPKRRNTHGQFAEVNFHSHKSSMTLNGNATSSPSARQTTMKRRNTEYAAQQPDGSNPIPRRKTIKKAGQEPPASAHDDLRRRTSPSTQNTQTRRQTEVQTKENILTQPRKANQRQKTKRSKTIGAFVGEHKDTVHRQSAVDFTVQSEETTSTASPQTESGAAAAHDTRNSKDIKRSKRSTRTRGVGSTTSENVRKGYQSARSTGSKTTNDADVRRGKQNGTSTRDTQAPGSIATPKVQKKADDIDIERYDSDQSFEVHSGREGSGSPTRHRATTASRVSVATRGPETPGRKSFIKRLLSRSTEKSEANPTSFRKRMSSIFRGPGQKSFVDIKEPIE